MRFGLLLLLLLAAASRRELDLPYGQITSVVSPDGAWRLYGVPYRKARNAGPELWLENLRTHGGRRVTGIADTLRAGWFPGSAAFWVQDHTASDRTQSYIYDAATLNRLDLRRAVLAEDPSIAGFDDGHRYYNVESADSRGLVIDFKGHTDRAPVTCFDYRYRVTRARVVRKLGGRAWHLEIGTPGCG